MRLRPLVLSALVALLLASTASATPTRPLRIAAYYPWFPEGWTYTMNPFTHFQPSLGFYDAGDVRTIEHHVRAMRWGHIRAATYSWWGRASATDQRLAAHLSVGARQRFRFAVYYELEGYGDPTAEALRADLEHIRDAYAPSPGYLKLGGRFVVFVYTDADDGVDCDVAKRWSAAGEGLGAYVVLRAFRGYGSCSTQPQGWHAYAAHKYEAVLGRYAYTISPGFFFAPEDRPLRRRNLRSWARIVDRMRRSDAQFHYVISYNEWGEGTAVESALEWSSASGYGDYLDVLHALPGPPGRP